MFSVRLLYFLYGLERRLPMHVILLPSVNLSSFVAEHRARIETTLGEARQPIASKTQRGPTRNESPVRLVYSSLV